MKRNTIKLERQNVIRMCLHGCQDVPYLFIEASLLYIQVMF